MFKVYVIHENSYYSVKPRLLIFMRKSVNIYNEEWSVIK